MKWGPGPAGLLSHCKDVGWLLLSVKWGRLHRVLGRGGTKSDLHVKRIPLATVWREGKGRTMATPARGLVG